MKRAMMTALVAAAAAATMTVAPSASLHAQTRAKTPPAPLADRNKIPGPLAPPVFKVPAFTIDTLSNGARLVVVERHALPIVNVSIHFEGGTNALGAKAAAATFLAGMTREGTETRTAEQLANDLAMLGSGINIGVGTESGTAGFSTLVTNVDRSMDLMMDMMLHSTYPAASLERLRTQSLSAYLRGQDNVTTIAGQVAPKLVYGDQPYGRVTTDADIKSVTREDVVNLAKQMFVPVNATVYVVGDMTRAQARAAMERGFKSWPRSGSKVAFTYPPAPTPGPTTIYVVDMPNKPQSYLRITRALPPAYGPDMAKIDVANYVLGGGLQSRLSANIREAHGYSYGFNSGLQWSKGPGPFIASGSVTREKTDSSVIEAMKELRGMTGARPVSIDELNAAKNALTQSLPVRLQSNANVSGIVSRIVDEHLDRNWWSQYINTVQNTTPADIAAISKQYLDPDHTVIVIAGDAAKIMSSLKAAGVANVVQVDKTGKPITP